MIQELLERQGAHLVCVDTGQQALERVKQAGGDSFDALLTDLQMPGMDGYQTAAQMRELAPSLPVIGLSGNTSAQERARCLDAGMVDLVPKPFDFELLVAVINRHARGHPLEPKKTGIDWVGLMSRYGNREGFVTHLVETIRSSQANTPAKLRAAAESKDMPQLSSLAHTLKGTAGNLMADTLRDLAARTERAAQSGAGEAATLARQLATILEETLAAPGPQSGAQQGGGS